MVLILHISKIATLAVSPTCLRTKHTTNKPHLHQNSSTVSFLKEFTHKWLFISFEREIFSLNNISANNQPRNNQVVNNCKHRLDR